jgi:hypothetical protein
MLLTGKCLLFQQRLHGWLDFAHCRFTKRAEKKAGSRNAGVTMIREARAPEPFPSISESGVEVFRGDLSATKQGLSADNIGSAMRPDDECRAVQVTVFIDKKLACLQEF